MIFPSPPWEASQAKGCREQRAGWKLPSRQPDTEHAFSHRLTYCQEIVSAQTQLLTPDQWVLTVAPVISDLTPQSVTGDVSSSLHAGIAAEATLTTGCRQRGKELLLTRLKLACE